MAEHLSQLGIELSDSSNRDVREAFRRAYDIIEEEQIALKSIHPNNPLLRLVSLHPDRDGMNFADNFRSLVLEHDGLEITSGRYTFYYLIGSYIDLLRTEQTNPKYPSS